MVRLRDVSPIKRLIFGSAVYALVGVYASWMLGGWFLITAGMLVVGLVAGAAFIWFVVRRLNCRDDPRHADWPPDPP